MVATNALEAFDLAENELRSSNFESALANYLRVLTSVPDHWRSRFRIADVLLSLNGAHHAFDIYKSIAIHAVKSGHPLWGLVAIKMAAAMDKSQGELVHVVAELYGKDSPRIDRSLREASRRVLRKTDPLGNIGFLSGTKLVEEAASTAKDLSAIESFPNNLPAIPLFSYLDIDAFGAVLGGIQLRRFVKGQDIIKEGQPGASFFILAQGDVVVTKQAGGRTLNLARLRYGAVFGEMALIRQAPRAATVTAVSDCDLLELSRDFLEQEGQNLSSVTKALHEFTHERFLANLAATCAVFKPFPRTIRATILKKFETLNAQPGDVLIREGEQGRGLYLILKGHVEVMKANPENDTPLHLAVLKEGDVFGEISLIQSTPTTATCRMQTRGELLFLPAKVFNSTMARHPELRDELAKVTAERIARTKETLNPEEEGFILIEDDDLIML